jgi:predicted phosphodiesterase
MSDFSTSNRRGFITALAQLSALSAISLSPFKVLSAPLRDASVSIVTGPYLQAVSATSMSIRWITNTNSYGWVEYGETEALGNKAHAVTDGLVNAHTRIHEVVVSGLEPGRQYYYRIASKEILDFQPYKLMYGETTHSAVYTLQTVDPQAIQTNWLVLNDIHDRPHSFGELIRHNGDAPYDFVFLNGDMFDYQTDEQQLIDHLIHPCTETFARKKPFLFIRGNHETRGKFARQLKDYFTNPGGQYFSIKTGPVFAVALDTGEDKPDTEPVYAGIVDFDQYRMQQAIWLEKQLQLKEARKARFRVVMMHIPPFYSGDWHGTLHCRKLFSPLFDRYRVDLVIAGHTHKHGIHPPVKGEHSYPIIIGGGPKEGKRTLIKVSADANQLAVKMLGDTGAELGEYKISSR